MALLVLKKRRPLRKRWLLVGILLPVFYLIYAVSNKLSVNGQIERVLKVHRIPYNNFITKPTAFNTWLWYVFVPTEEGYYIGYRSVFDAEEYLTPFEYYPQNGYLLAVQEISEDIDRLKIFANGQYTVEQHGDSLLFNIVRFGRIAGWDQGDTDFTFHYYLNEGFDNTTVMQRGRLREWNFDTMIRMIRRIKGVEVE